MKNCSMQGQSLSKNHHSDSTEQAPFRFFEIQLITFTDGIVLPQALSQVWWHTDCQLTIAMWA